MIRQDEIRTIVLQLEELHQAKSTIVQDIANLLSEAKYKGYNIKILRQLLKLRQMNNDDRIKEEEELSDYKIAIGME